MFGDRRRFVVHGPTLVAGQRIRVTKGPFAGLQGYVVKKLLKMWTIRIDTLPAGTLLEIPSDFIEPE